MRKQSQLAVKTINNQAAIIVKTIEQGIECQVPAIGNFIKYSPSEIRQMIGAWIIGIYQFFDTTHNKDSVIKTVDHICEHYNNLKLPEFKIIEKRILENVNGYISCPKIILEIETYWSERINSAESLNDDKHALTKNQSRKQFNIFAKFYDK